MSGVHIDLPPAALAQSRWAISPAAQVVGCVQHHSAPHLWPHLLRWQSRAAERALSDSLVLLGSLLPQRGYTPEFLVPVPRRRVETPERTWAQVRETPTEMVERQLDHAFRGRRSPPDLVRAYGSQAAFERSRREMPAVVRRLLRGGGADVFARACADALSDYFAAAVADEWPHVVAVLEEDVANRTAHSVARGTLAMLGELGEGITTRSGALHLPRPYDLTLEGGRQGLVLLPSVGHTDRVVLSGHQAPTATPALVYPALGAARLWHDPGSTAPQALADLVGTARADLIERLVAPMTAVELGAETGLSGPTTTYHLGILLRAGLVERRRAGRSVRYGRTPVGEALLVGPGGRRPPGR